MSVDREITVIATTLSGKERHRAYVAPTTTAKQVMDSLFLHRNFTRFALDGRECEGAAPIGDASVVSGWETPSDPSVLIGIVVTVILSAVGYFVNRRQLTKMGRYKKTDQETSETNYGWDYDAENAVQEGAPVPVLYGRRLVIPPVASQRIHDVNETGESFLDCTYAVADGGAGFSDIIRYIAEGDSRYYARIDHTPWENLNKGTVSSSPNDNWRTFAQTYGEAFTAVPTASWQANTFSGGTKREWLTDGDLTASKKLEASDGIFLHFTQAINITSLQIYTRVKAGDYVWHDFDLYGLDNTGEGQTARWTKIGSSEGCYSTDLDNNVIVPPTGGAILVTLYRGRDKNDVKRHRFRIRPTSTWQIRKMSGNRVVKWNHASGSKPKKNFTEIRVGGEYTSSGAAVGGGKIALETTAGLYGETPTTFQTGTWSGANVDKYLETEWFQFATTPRAYPDHAAIHFSFPYGCYKINQETGDTENSYVTLHAQYRKIAADGTAGAWTDFFTSSHAETDITYNSGDGSVTVGLATQSASNLTFQRDGIGDGAARLELRVKRGDAPADSAAEINVCQWTVLEEGWSFVPAYPRTATAVLQMNASEKFNGRLPQFSICAERATVYAFNTISGLWESHSASNPAWAAYDLIVRPRFDDAGHGGPDESGALLRESFPHERMLYGEFSAWADWCDENDVTCSMYYDAQTTIDRGVQYLCDLGRAQIVLKGGSIGVAVDRRADLDADGNPVSVFAFTDANIVANSWSVQFRDRADLPSEYEVTFFDRDREWNRFTVIARDAELDNEATAQNTQSVTLYACDRREVAQAFAEYAIRQNMVSRTYSWSGGIDAMPVEIGDIVSVKGELVRVTSVAVEEDFTRKYEGVEYVDARFA